MLQVGEKYISRRTDRNTRNQISAGKEVRIAHVSPTAISVRIFQNGSELQLSVPRELFGVNFEEERSFVPPNRAYASPVPFMKSYV